MNIERMQQLRDAIANESIEGLKFRGDFFFGADGYACFGGYATYLALGLTKAEHADVVYNRMGGKGAGMFAREWLDLTPRQSRELFSSDLSVNTRDKEGAVRILDRILATGEFPVY